MIYTIYTKTRRPYQFGCTAVCAGLQLMGGPGQFFAHISLYFWKSLLPKSIFHFSLMSLFVHLLTAVPRDVKNKNMSLVQYGAQFCFSFHCGYFLLCVFGSFASLFVFLAHFHGPGHHVVSADCSGPRFPATPTSHCSDPSS